MWKTVKTHTNYEVCIDGRVRKKAIQITYSNGVITKYKERMLKPDVSSMNYCRVTLSQGNRQERISVHRLVAEHFLDKVEGKRFVNHKDGNRMNNHADNLEWCTSSENELHSYRVLGKVNPIRKLTNEQAAYIRSQRGAIPSRHLAKQYGVDKAVILHIWKNKTYVTA